MSTSVSYHAPEKNVTAHGPASLAILLLWGIIGLNVLMIPPTLVDISILKGMLANGASPADIPSHFNGSLLLLLWLVKLAAWITAVVVIPLWMHHAYRLMEQHRVRELQHTPTQAAAFWFIPILNLYKPYVIMHELNEKSGPTVFGRPFGTTTEPSPPWLLAAWWGTFLVGHIFGRVSFTLGIGSTTINRLIVSDWLDLGAGLLEIVAGLFLIRIITSIDRRQEVRFGQSPRPPRPERDEPAHAERNELLDAVTG